MRQGGTRDDGRRDEDHGTDSSPSCSSLIRTLPQHVSMHLPASQAPGEAASPFITTTTRCMDLHNKHQHHHSYPKTPHHHHLPNLTTPPPTHPPAPSPLAPHILGIKTGEPAGPAGSPVPARLEQPKDPDFLMAGEPATTWASQSQTSQSQCCAVPQSSTKSPVSPTQKKGGFDWGPRIHNYPCLHTYMHTYAGHQPHRTQPKSFLPAPCRCEAAKKRLAGQGTPGKMQPPSSLPTARKYSAPGSVVGGAYTLAR